MRSMWVERDGSNNIISVHGVEQYEGQEKKTDQDQEVMDFIHPPYASDLAGAKVKRQAEARAEAGMLYQQYVQTDLELTLADLATYRASLVSQTGAFTTEINALNTIQGVREYEYSGWPATP